MINLYDDSYKTNPYNAFLYTKKVTTPDDKPLRMDSLSNIIPKFGVY